MKIKRSRFLVGGLIVALFIILVFFNEIMSFLVNYQWFGEVGYREVFLTKMKMQLLIGVPFFLILTVVLYTYLLMLKKSYYKHIVSYHTGIAEKSLNKILLIPSIFFSFVTTTTAVGSLWFDILQFINGISFNIADPIFNRDIGFYFFHLPLFRGILNTVLGLLFVFVILTVLFNAIMFSLRRPTLYQVEEGAGKGTALFHTIGQVTKKQLIVIGAIFLMTLSFSFYLSGYNLLLAGGGERGVVFGAGYSDIMVTLNTYRAQAITAIIAAVLLVIGYRKSKIKSMIAAPILLVLVSIVGNIAALGVQNFAVAPNELSRERQYIEYNIASTKRAYGLDKVAIDEFEVDNDLTLADLKSNKETIDNIRINDYRPAIETYNQVQAIRSYYRFLDVDIDRYYINGNYTQVFLAPREIDINLLSDTAKTWINQHLKYTHGYGVVLSPVNAVTSEGQPELAIKNVPPVSSIDISIDRPEIYFGELTNHHIIVKTEEKEFDYPTGNDNAETTYEGNAGIQLKGLNRLLYSYHTKTLKLLLSGSITNESRIILHRNIIERVNKIAPFIKYDEDPYIVIAEGRLYWIIDGYTVSNQYPYSTPTRMAGESLNYIRNSVKVVIDAYNGDVDYYIADKEDPVILTYQNIFPSLFKPIEEMPDGLKGHVRYPQDLFDLQTQVYAIYHMTNPSVFYNQEDVWYLAKEKYGDAQQDVESQYMIMKLPDEKKEELILSVSYTPKGLQNLTALLMVRNDIDNYGELKLYRMPKDRNIDGPMQIEAKIDSDTIISKDLSLWGEGGSSVIRGNVLVIPIERSILYVEPLYIRGSSNSGQSLPLVKRVIVAYRDKVVMEETLQQALESLFGSYTDIDTPIEKPVEESPSELPQSTKELIEAAVSVYENAKAASQAGNWAEYGKFIDELETILKQLQSEEITEN